MNFLPLPHGQSSFRPTFLRPDAICTMETRGFLGHRCMTFSMLESASQGSSWITAPRICADPGSNSNPYQASALVSYFRTWQCIKSRSRALPSSRLLQWTVMPKRFPSTPTEMSCPLPSSWASRTIRSIPSLNNLAVLELSWSNKRPKPVRSGVPAASTSWKTRPINNPSKRVSNPLGVRSPGGLGAARAWRCQEERRSRPPRLAISYCVSTRDCGQGGSPEWPAPD